MYYILRMIHNIWMIPNEQHRPIRYINRYLRSTAVGQCNKLDSYNIDILWKEVLFVTSIHNLFINSVALVLNENEFCHLSSKGN